jgi:hypothetical protein
MDGHPSHLAFDGANIWVTETDLNTVTKLRESDGAPLGTFAVGAEPDPSFSTGEYLGLRHSLDCTMTKLRASDGTVLGTFPVVPRGNSLEGVAWDGANVLGRPLLRLHFWFRLGD